MLLAILNFYKTYGLNDIGYFLLIVIQAITNTTFKIKFMKKRNLKNLELNKISVSNLHRGGLEGNTNGEVTALNSDAIGCWSDGLNSCPSEAPSGCETQEEKTCVECERLSTP